MPALPGVTVVVVRRRVLPLIELPDIEVLPLVEVLPCTVVRLEAPVPTDCERLLPIVVLPFITVPVVF